VNIRNHDLNLLAVFVGIGEELNLTRASGRLGLSQPALSHALARLRDEFGDDLFVRGHRGLVATPRAEELLPQIRTLLEQTEGLYQGERLNLVTIERTVVIASTDYYQARKIESVIRQMWQAAPKLRIETRSLTGEFPGPELESGTIDVAIAAYLEEPASRFRSQIIYRDPFVCVCASTNPYLRARDKRKAYLSAQHLQIAVPPGAVPPIDRYLATEGLSRDLRLRIGNFLTPPDLLASSDLLVTCPRSLAEFYAKAHPLTVSKLPFALPELETRMIWHQKHDRDPFHTWLRAQLVE